MQHRSTVEAIYSAFARGDITAILAHLADDVEWEYDKANGEIPWLLPRRGPAEAANFFKALGAVSFEQFEPKVLLERGNIVVSLNDVIFTVKATGQRVSERDEVHIWHFDDNGKVRKFCHKTDTHAHWLALQQP